MALDRLEIRDFRCLRSVQADCHPQLNIIHGSNASGKTSLLEAIWFLGRGRSFRSRHRQSLVCQSAGALSVFALINTTGQQPHRLGIGYGPDGLRARLDGETVRQVSVLARHLPVQMIDPHVHRLIEGGPGERRQFLDWGLFHVEQGFLSVWTRYRKALRQRNAALRQSASSDMLAVWESRLAESGEALSDYRQAYVQRLQPLVQQTINQVLGKTPVNLVYQQGWASGQSLAEALARGRSHEQQTGVSRSGPHRADMEIRLGDVPAIERVSRGQEKILASCLVLAQQQLYTEESGDPGVLLLDDVASELDARYLSRFMQIVSEMPAQKFLTVISPDSLRDQIPGEAGLFHVEQGQLGKH